MSWVAMGASALGQLLCRTEVRKLSKVFSGEGCFDYRRYHCSEIYLLLSTYFVRYPA